jgi:hypothetical protein
MTAPSRTNAPAKLVTIFDSELVELSQFVATQSGRASAAVESYLRWFLLDNPARHPQIPLGCGLRSPEGQLVGCILYVPQMFRFQQQTLLVAGSSSFYVDELHRGSGGLLFLRFSELARKFPLFGNSANADAAKLWKARGAVPIPNSDYELFGVLRWDGVIEEALTRRGVPKTLAQVARGAVALAVSPLKRLNLPAGRAEDLIPLRSAEEVQQLPIHDAPLALTSIRDLSYIRWRYFSGRDATIGPFAFRNQQTDTPVFVAINRRPRGYRGQIRTLNVLDIYPEIQPGGLVHIVAALADRYRGEVDAIVLRSLNESRQNTFRSLGFIRRPFDAPNGWLLDKSGFFPTQNWYTVPADGDWLL